MGRPSVVSLPFPFSSKRREGRLVAPERETNKDRRQRTPSGRRLDFRGPQLKPIRLMGESHSSCRNVTGVPGRRNNVTGNTLYQGARIHLPHMVCNPEKCRIGWKTARCPGEISSWTCGLHGIYHNGGLIPGISCPFLKTSGHFRRT